MISDQADELRLLVGRRRIPPAKCGSSPPVVVVAGGSAGAGATTLATNLTIALAHHGHRALLIDLDVQRATASRLCQINDCETLWDLFTGAKSIHEVTQPGPHGILVLASSHASPDKTLPDGDRWKRLLEQVNGLTSYVDQIVIDAGPSPVAVLESLGSRADLIIVVATWRPQEIVDAYALVKQISAPSRVACAINRVPNQEAAQSVYSRLADVSRRFLSRELHYLGGVPEDYAVEKAHASLRPVLVASHRTPATRALVGMAERVIEELRVAGEVRQSPLPARERAI